MHSVDRPYDEGRGRGGQPPHEDGVEQGHAGPRLLLEVGLQGEERPPAQHLVQYSTVQYNTVQYSTVQHLAAGEAGRGLGLAGGGLALHVYTDHVSCLHLGPGGDRG